MALKVISQTHNIRVISRKDDAVPETLSDEQWEKYRDTLDEKLLGLISEPTRFVLKTHLPFAAQQHLASEQMHMGQDGKTEMRFGFILEEVRYALENIENPPGMEEDQKLVFAKDKDGYASKELVALLHCAGIVIELYAARSAAMARNAPTKK
jgi:hypothetical protein